MMANYRSPAKSSVTLCAVCHAQLFDGVPHNCIVKSPVEVRLEDYERRIRALEEQLTELKHELWSLQDWRREQTGGK